MASTLFGQYVTNFTVIMPQNAYTICNVRRRSAPCRPTASPFFIVGGTVPSDAPCYVTRQADADLFNALQNAAFCFVLDTRQVGKSSLMARVAERLRKGDVRVALLDLTALGKEDNPDNWHYGLLELIGQELRCLRPLRAFWEANGGLPLTQRFMQAIEQVALETEPTPLVLAIDEIDFVRSLPFDTDDFFTGIRECHNRRSHQPALKRLTFCLIGSATPNDLIQNVHITPFNIGRRVTITDFTEQEAQPLAEGLTAAGKDGKTLLAHILYWTNGHPYLTQRLCAAAAVASDVNGVGNIDSLVKRLFLSRRASAAEDVNLTFVRDRLLKSDLDKDKLFGLYQTIHAGKRAIPDDPRDPYCNALRLSGIVAERDGFLFVRNRVYRELFSPEWAQEQMPGIEAVRQRREVRRARLQIGSVAAAIVLALSALTGIALWNAGRAHKNAQQLQIALNDAQTARSSADRYLYITNMNLIQRDYETNNIGNVLSLLEQTRTSPYRSFEWGYWNRLCHLDLLTMSGEACITSVAFSADDQRILTTENVDVTSIVGSGFRREVPPKGGLVRLWNARTGEELFKGQPLGDASCVFSPDGHRIATGSEDGTIRVFDVPSRRAILVLKGHAKKVTSVAFSPDGKRIVTGSEDKTAKLWDAQNGRETLTLKGFMGKVNSVAFSEDGRRIVTASGSQANIYFSDSNDWKGTMEENVQPSQAQCLINGNKNKEAGAKY